MKQFITVKEAAEMLELTRFRVTNLVKTGQLVAAKVEGSLRFRRKDVELYIERRLSAPGETDRYVQGLSVPKGYLMPSEVAEILGCSISTVYTYSTRGLLPSLKVGNRYIYKKEDVGTATIEVNGVKQLKGALVREKWLYVMPSGQKYTHEQLMKLPNGLLYVSRCIAGTGGYSQERISDSNIEEVSKALTNTTSGEPISEKFYEAVRGIIAEEIKKYFESQKSVGDENTELPRTAHRKRILNKRG